MIELLFLIFPISGELVYNDFTMIQHYQILSFNIDTDKLYIKEQLLPVYSTGKIIDFQVGYQWLK